MNGTQTPSLADIRPCLEGAIPGVMATASVDGVANVAYVSQVFYVDDRHVALSFQFFNKSRQNILANPQATVLVVHPRTAAFYRLHLHYLHTEIAGPVFEAMKAQLAGIASHAGMAGVFRLRGSDIYEVRQIEAIAGQPLAPPPARSAVLAALRRGSQRMSGCSTLEELLGTALLTMRQVLDTDHGMVLLLDPVSRKLYTVASCGYATSGLGSEIDLGDGVIGVAAEHRTAVRIVHMTSAYLYQRAVRQSWRSDRPDLVLDTDIPYPGLAEPHSQMAVPILSGGQLRGVLFAESPHELRFDYEQEDMLVVLAGQLGAAIDQLQDNGANPDQEPAGDGVSAEAGDTPSGRPRGAILRVRHYQLNNSIFLDDSYLIKGVAGAIFWKLVNDYTRHGRSEFSNRELRLDPAIGLPELTDNLEARLLLLQRRLAEHKAPIQIEKTGRGRFRLAVTRPLALVDNSP